MLPRTLPGPLTYKSVTRPCEYMMGLLTAPEMYRSMRSMFFMPAIVGS